MTSLRTSGLLSLLNDGKSRSVDQIAAETRLTREVVAKTIHIMRNCGLVASQPVVYGLTATGKASLHDRIRLQEAKAAISARKSKRAAAKVSPKRVVHRDEEAGPCSTNDIVASAMAAHTSNPLFNFARP